MMSCMAVRLYGVKCCEASCRVTINTLPTHTYWTRTCTWNNTSSPHHHTCNLQPITIQPSTQHRPYNTPRCTLPVGRARTDTDQHSKGCYLDGTYVVHTCTLRLAQCTVHAVTCMVHVFWHSARCYLYGTCLLAQCTLLLVMVHVYWHSARCYLYDTCLLAQFTLLLGLYVRAYCDWHSEGCYLDDTCMTTATGRVHTVTCMIRLYARAW